MLCCYLQKIYSDIYENKIIFPNIGSIGLLQTCMIPLIIDCCVGLPGKLAKHYWQWYCGKSGSCLGKVVCPLVRCRPPRCSACRHVTPPGHGGLQRRATTLANISTLQSISQAGFGSIAARQASTALHPLLNTHQQTLQELHFDIVVYCRGARLRRRLVVPSGRHW